MLNRKGVVVREFLHVARIAAVMAQLMPRFGDADLWDRKRIALAAQAEGRYSRRIGLKGEHD